MENESVQMILAAIMDKANISHIEIPLSELSHIEGAVATGLDVVNGVITVERVLV